MYKESFAIRDLAVSAAVNDVSILESCLASSPDIVCETISLKTYQGYENAGEAINSAINDAGSRLLVIAHQDVYLPRGFAARLVVSLNALTLLDPEWAVVGCIGVDAHGELVGRTWSTGIGRVLGDINKLPAEVSSLDELILVVRTDMGLTFDPDLPSFHLYGTDIVQIARAAGRKGYVIDMPVIHHSRPLISLRGGYFNSYKYLQKKWRRALPIPTLMGGLRRSTLRLLIAEVTIRWRSRGATTRRAAEGNPEEIAERIGFHSF